MLVSNVNVYKIPSPTNTFGSVGASVVATATHQLSLTREGTHCVDAVERWATRLGGGTTLISICNSGCRRNQRCAHER